MNQNTIIALAYLLAEAVAAGIAISDVLAQADEAGALPPDEIDKIKTSLKADFTDAREFWGVDDEEDG